MEYKKIFLRYITKGYVKIPKPRHLKGDYKTSFYRNLRICLKEDSIIFYTAYFKKDGKLQGWMREYYYEFGIKNLKKHLRRIAQNLVHLYESHPDYKDNDLRYIAPKRLHTRFGSKFYENK